MKKEDEQDGKVKEGNIAEFMLDAGSSQDDISRMIDRSKCHLPHRITYTASQGKRTCPRPRASPVCELLTGSSIAGKKDE